MSSPVVSKRLVRPGTNPRKPSQRGFPDLSRYDRLDPFTAANALRKLHLSLPNDPGSHRYKITQDLPTETWDDIISYVDSQCDLLSLTWSCHRMHDVVFHRHFEHRAVKARVSSTKVWHRLTVHCALARNVRHLEIVDEKSSEIIPTDDDVDDGLNLSTKQEFLASAIAGMHGLQSFKWSHTDSLVLIGGLWPALHNCPNLTHVSLGDNTLFSPPKNQDPGEEGDNGHAEKDTTLKGITTVSVKSNRGSGTVMNPQLAQISGLLSSCPDLLNLEIIYLVPPDPGFIHPIADDFYSCGYWKNLTSLTLNNLCCTPQGLGNLATFLSEHDNLETLHFKSVGANTAALATFLPHNTLPRLKELKSDQNFANAILSCNAVPPRPLKTLKGIGLGGPKLSRAFLMNLARAGGGISRIELTGWKKMMYLRELLQCVPNLTWLDVGNTPNRAVRAYGPDHWTTTLGLVPNIQTFFGVKLFHQIPDTPVGDMSESDRSKFMDNNKIASILAQRCPELKRLEHWGDERSKVIVLVRRDPDCKYRVAEKSDKL